MGFMSACCSSGVWRNQSCYCVKLCGALHAALLYARENQIYFGLKVWAVCVRLLSFFP